MREIAAHPTNFTAGRKLPVDRIVIHYTAGDGDTAENNGHYFAGAERNASAHYFVDETDVVRSVSEEDTAWHAGVWEMNSRSIGVELCSKKDSGGKYFLPAQTVQNAQHLVRDIMARYAVPISAILRHYDVTGKNCPAPMVEDESLWRSFLNGLQADAPSPWAQEACTWAVEQGLFRGDGEGFCWQENVTREQLAVILHRMAKK